jgi:hypothetical protein
MFLWRVHMSPTGEMKMSSACSRNNLLTRKEITPICAHDISQVSGWPDSMGLSEMVAHCTPLHWNPNLSFATTTMDICSSTWLCNKHALINYASCTVFNSQKYEIHISLWNLDYMNYRSRSPLHLSMANPGNEPRLPCHTVFILVPSVILKRYKWYEISFLPLFFVRSLDLDFHSVLLTQPSQKDKLSYPLAQSASALLEELFPDCSEEGGCCEFQLCGEKDDRRVQ